MVQVFAFERALAERGDRACYTINLDSAIGMNSEGAKARSKTGSGRKQGLPCG
jgi:hypothetical protein